MTAVRVLAKGGPETLVVDSKLPIPAVGPAQILVKVAFAGVNYIDTYQRSGLYAVPLPFTLGREGSGVVEKVGHEVKEFKAGDRVVFFAESSYAQYVALPADKAVLVPPSVTLADASAVLLQGMTAHAMMTSTYAVKEGDTVLIHAGAGGTGQMLVQIAKLKGAKVITTVGSKDKEVIVNALGADVVINYTSGDFVEEVKKATEGKLCNAVYDGVGAATSAKSLKCCGLLGHLILFGNASGKAPAVEPLDLSAQGSVSLTRPNLMHYITTRALLLARCNDLFAWIKAGKLKVSVGKTFALASAGDAHRLLEGRGSTGKILLIADSTLADK